MAKRAKRTKRRRRACCVYCHGGKSPYMFQVRLDDRLADICPRDFWLTQEIARNNRRL